jgi:hypothetical protein
VDDVGREVREGPHEPTDAGPPDADRLVAGQPRGRDPDDGRGSVGGRGGAARRVGRDDERRVAPPVEVLEDTQQRVGDPVDLGQERLGDDRDAHPASVAAAGDGSANAR